MKTKVMEFRKNCTCIMIREEKYLIILAQQLLTRKMESYEGQNKLELY